MMNTPKSRPSNLLSRRKNKSNSDVANLLKFGANHDYDMVSDVEAQLEHINELAQPEESEAGTVRSERSDKRLLKKAL